LIQLEPTSAAPWAREMIGAEAVRMRALAANARKHAQKHALARPAANYTADAYEEAAILLEKRLAGINPAQERTA
jgi:hypothetical protein